MHEQDITRRQPGHHLSQMERGRIAELYATAFKAACMGSPVPAGFPFSVFTIACPLKTG
ncbi:hypothetical protein [Furfurilactobacillus siliginis]|uniref:Uncharacterized protein n=1 Tax=Furfurilactobacillus siliginis TaxID=348151 RepID=A0A510VP38_9LACO|nr:hypothetical protein [Furfurilactobacillus siliginis]GEK28708.1 hypothetical protein LSI01_10190 [Furfurilactobacillus siliginis]